eukprot:350949-Chlamydomonas_euryale.AAC.2
MQHRPNQQPGSQIIREKGPMDLLPSPSGVPFAMEAPRVPRVEVSAAAEGHIDPAALEQIIELARSHLPPGSEESTMADAEQGSWMDGHNGGNNHEQLE